MVRARDRHRASGLCTERRAPSERAADDEPAETVADQVNSRGAGGRERPQRPIRWLAYYSDGDRVVTPASARLDDPRYGAANLLIPGCGHLTICRDVRLIRSLVRELSRTETHAHADAALPAGASREPKAA